MARPKKKGVDYYPHDCVTGKTVFVLEQKFGNDGYAFWFKLLEFLGTKEGHYLDCNDIADMEFLQAKTRLDAEIMYKILDLLSNLEAIDRELWQKKVVWSQRFVDGISDVYINRRVEIPKRPSFYIVSTDHNPAEVAIPDEPTSKSTQSKVKESKVKENQIERVDEIIIQLEKNLNIKVASSEKNYYMFLVVEMSKIFTEEIPEYFFDKETDYSACLQIAYNIAKMKKWSKVEVLNGKMNDTIESWKTIVAFIKTDEWLKTRSLTDISSVKEWQRLVLKMKNKDGKVNTTNTGGQFIPD